jgi:rare lipoprotein A
MFSAVIIRGRSPIAIALVAFFTIVFPAREAVAGRPAVPVVTSAPKLVHYGENARIVGEVKNGGRRLMVHLKQSLAGGGREFVRVQRLGRDGIVKFILHDRTVSANYRLVVHPGEPNKRVSKAARIEVTPRFTFHVDPNDTKTGRSVRVSGELLPVVEGRRARVEMRVNGKWALVAKLDASDGGYQRSFKPEVRGRREMRALFAGDEVNARARRRARLWVYRRAQATWYGPGFYGNQTACGQTLRRKTLGVAHRTLDCGTAVDFLYKGRTITVDVIDRGPYGKADWDLTSATRKRLRFEGRDEIGYIAH